MKTPWLLLEEFKYILYDTCHCFLDYWYNACQNSCANSSLTPRIHKKSNGALQNSRSVCFHVSPFERSREAHICLHETLWPSQKGNFENNVFLLITEALWAWVKGSIFQFGFLWNSLSVPYTWAVPLGLLFHCRFPAISLHIAVARKLNWKFQEHNNTCFIEYNFGNSTINARKWSSFELPSMWFVYSGLRSIACLCELCGHPKDMA